VNPQSEAVEAEVRTVTKRRFAIFVVVAAALVGAGLALASQVKVTVGSYTGQSSEHQTVTLTVVGRTIKNLKTTIGYNGKCGQGGGPGYNINAKANIKNNGTFSANITLTGEVSAIKSVQGKLTGKASGSKITGTIDDLSTAKFKCNGYIETFSVTHGTLTF
jgi:hypothetical protein